MIATRAILRFKRLLMPLKLGGVIFLVYHCATTDISFNPVWVAIYIGITISIANLCVSFETVFGKLRSKEEVAQSEFTKEQKYYVQKLYDQGHRFSRRPWTVLLIAGEDGIFFLPLLYIGITPLTAVTSAALFTIVHYRDKPNSALIGTFIFTVANLLIVLPHGILPMVIGHYILDATAFSLAPVLKNWVESDNETESMPNHALDPTSGNARGASSEGGQG